MAKETEYTNYQSLAKYLIGLDQRQRYLREKENNFYRQNIGSISTTSTLVTSTLVLTTSIPLRPTTTA